MGAVGEDYILTEYTGAGRKKPEFFEDFGRRLARMQRYTAGTFGFREDNYIGTNLQPNLTSEKEASEWTRFWFNKRLLFQFRLAEKKGYIRQQLRADFALLENRIGKILDGSQEPPSLLHGDLWAGNFLCGNDGYVVLIDPAVYYGHREADLAMTRLFGGFPPLFYDAYDDEWPLPEGWQYRQDIYMLYHVLNHLNLFGRSYLSQVERIVAGYAR